MRLTAHITNSEARFLQPVEDFFRSKFRGENLISHGLDHHRRVWLFAKEILKHSLQPDIIIDPEFLDKLLIACYLHDIGMIRDHGPHHGQYSMDICTEFLKSINIRIEEYSDVLYAIRNHDDKEYHDKQNKDPLLKYLSAADDLDAFGVTGVYRYTEIYILRGVNPSELGYLILENASCRFSNFRSVFNSYTPLIEKHSKRFDILSDFFIKYNNQVVSYKFRCNAPSGHCGVVEIINDIIENRADPYLYINSRIKDDSDPIIKEFFVLLNKEMV